MDNKTYLEEAQTSNDKKYKEVIKRFQDHHNVRRMHAAIGISGEAGEIDDAIKKSIYYGKELDVENIKEECGDLLWYMAILLHDIGSSFDEVMGQNIVKLRKRYPSGHFTEKDALERKDKK
jgi:NTP pyrophosphatase (non-canonical NTP hydrolase)